ncbi:hypothetical protein TCAP_05503, partial [Tolypocladium capitatum]
STFQHRSESFASSRLAASTTQQRPLASTARPKFTHPNGFRQGPRQAGQGDPSSRPNRLSWWRHPGARRVHGRPDAIHHPERQRPCSRGRHPVPARVRTRSQTSAIDNDGGAGVGCKTTRDGWVGHEGWVEHESWGRRFVGVSALGHGPLADELSSRTTGRLPGREHLDSFSGL